MREITRLADCQARNFFDAPEAFTKKNVKAWLISKGAKGIITANGVAYIIGIHARTVKDAERAGKITPIDKCTYTLDDVAQWLYENPRHIAQSLPKFEADEETAGMIKAVLLSNFRGLVRAWDGGELDDLVNEVIYRLIQKRRATISKTTVVFSICNDIWRELIPRLRFKNQTVSLNDINREI